MTLTFEVQVTNRSSKVEKFAKRKFSNGKIKKYKGNILKNG